MATKKKQTKKQAPKVNELTQRFATNLAQLRAEAKVSQDQLAKKVGMSTSYVSMLERAGRTPTLDAVCAVAKGLGLSDPARMFL